MLNVVKLSDKLSILVYAWCTQNQHLGKLCYKTFSLLPAFLVLVFSSQSNICGLSKDLPSDWGTRVHPCLSTIYELPRIVGSFVRVSVAKRKDKLYNLYQCLCHKILLQRYASVSVGDKLSSLDYLWVYAWHTLHQHLAKLEQAGNSCQTYTLA